MSGVVIDTTIWISALAFGGVPALAVEKAAANFKIAISKEIYKEIVEVVNRSKFEGKVNMTLVIRRLDLILAKRGEWVSLRGDITDCPDPKDNKFLDCALVAGANLILSSDRHLRRMDPYRGIRIVNPQEFLLL